jgi:hypothetical protein
MRRRKICRVPPEGQLICPVISSPLTVISPSTLPLVSLKRNTSPATVPAIAPGVAPKRPAPPPATWTNPLTTEPCWSSSSLKVPLGTGALANPSQVPVMSTVTSVRSIQSVDAQPELQTSAAAMSSRGMTLMSSARRPPARGVGSVRADRAGCTASPCRQWPPPLWPSLRPRPAQRT